MRIKFKFLLTAFLILSIQGLIIYFIAVKVYHKFTESKQTNIVHINKKIVPENLKSDLPYFNEIAPFAKDVVVINPSWLKNKHQYHINSVGFNNLSEFSIEKSPHTFRIMSIGDSYTLGLYVDTKDSYPEILRSLLTKKCQDQNFEVINLGVPGYDIRYTYERFRLSGQKYKPDLVLWFLKNDDFEDIHEYLTPKVLSYFVELSKKMDLDHANIEAYKKAQEDLNNELTQDQIDQYQIDALKDYSRIYAGKTLFFTFPFTKDDYKQLMTTFASFHTGFYVFTGLSDIENLGQVFPDHHPTEEGYRTIGQDLLKYLIQNKLVPCGTY